MFALLRNATFQGLLGAVILAVAVGSMVAKAPLHLDYVDMSGKTVIVTGGTNGVGLESAKILTTWGATVIVGARNMAKADRVLADIRRSCADKHKGNAAKCNIEAWKLDLASLASVRAFADKFIASRRPLHVLMNNAGILTPTGVLTEDGHDMMLQVNHLGHFLLTSKLLPILQRSAPARVVHVSSNAHRRGSGAAVTDFDALRGLHYMAYADTKLMNVVFSNELARRLEQQRGQGDKAVTSNSLHPGFVATGLFDDLVLPIRLLLQLATNLFAYDPQQGAYTQVRLATDPSLEEVTGVYFAACAPAMHHVNPAALDAAMGEALWNASSAALN